MSTTKTRKKDRKIRNVKTWVGAGKWCEEHHVDRAQVYRVREGLTLGARIRAMLEADGIKCRTYRPRNKRGV